MQTVKQVAFVNRFEDFLKHLRRVFVYPGIVPKSLPSTFQNTVTNQLRYLHGVEQRVLQSVPKIVHRVISRLISICLEIPENKDIVISAILEFEGMTAPKSRMCMVMGEVNEGSWGIVEVEDDVLFLVEMLLYWLISMKVSAFIT